ncbi:hypothetical protein PF005_g28548 [Phytophthora fragariae]|uniref:Uncharacterized protein n=1 Tax=Phytophthora fragariae TaxID=53985 RepID=A0A6A3Q3L7_9STRA|nr:hypothetical protein PF003_g5113 [Phytophthora fragariae]KAE9068165.1 hypothetical protein PF007_g27792 [Phytophthora fragariae]KAE9165760.1 hypothetical protein PF002_g31285 [Phytophthora fragariae]KAE9168049.1 hypothetical protein PF005_g28548 [Phytophthora fragariae]
MASDKELAQRSQIGNSSDSVKVGSNNTSDDSFSHLN